jgi:Holliday junction resolvasome RuvABC endonuclease subunit
VNVLGLDLGLTKTGWCADNDSGTIYAPAWAARSANRQKRNHWWGARLQQLIREHSIDHIVVEAPFIHTRNINGAVTVSMLHGVLDLAAGGAGISVQRVDNQVLKSWVYGHQVPYLTWPLDKDDMVTFARTQYGLECSDEENDRADAFLIHQYHRSHTS